MPRMPRVWGMPSLVRATSRSPAARRTPFVVTRANSTQKVRSMLWKDGEAPGPEDPYTQRTEPEDPSGIPDEARNRSAGGARDNRPRSLRETRLAMPAKRSEATTEQEIESSDPNYTPATSLDDLAEVGPLSTWWDQPGHWGPESAFKGFGRTTKVTDKDTVEVYLRRAVVEVLALQQTGQLSEWSTKKWSEGSSTALRAALETPITVADGGVPSLGGDAAAIVAQLTSTEEEGVSETVYPDEARELVKSWDSSWMDIPLDTEAKFAIRKRLYQLIGGLIPDSKIGAAKTVRHIMAIASSKPKPTKLSEVLEEKSDEFANLPNVRISSKKIGPIDKEIELGRWKVVKEELEKRGLPVTGTAGLSGNKERKWVRGLE